MLEQQIQEEVTPTTLYPAAASLQNHMEIARQEQAAAYKVETLLATVQEEARKLRRTRALGRTITLLFVGIMVLMILVFVAHGLRTGDWDSTNLWTQIGTGVAIGSVAASSKQHKEAVKAMADLEDVRAVGPLAESLIIEDKDVRGIVERVLIRLLPRLQASDTDKFTTEQRTALNEGLKSKNTELVIALLKAFEQIGDTKTLPLVEKLAQQTSNKRVREAAEQCLPFLRERAARARASQTLLRGSSALETGSEMLLRPAQDNSTASQQLLRAASEETSLPPSHVDPVA